MKSVLIVGAGMAGLMAAQNLASATILDKARGVGGRMATRRLLNGVFDHGAQYFTARDERFRAWVETWLGEEVAQIWSEDFRNQAGEARYIGTGGMTQIPKKLAEGLNIHLNQRVQKADLSGQTWQLTTETNQTFSAEALLLTAPVPQSLAILDAGNFALPAATRHALEAITYDPCYALMVALDSPSSIPAPGGIWGDGQPISWMADNFQKGISPQQHGVTIHSSADFARQHWDAPPDVVIDLLLQAAQLSGQVLESSLQRWRYSQPRVFYPEPCAVVEAPAPLILAGDAFQAARVEGAALSGLAAATQLRAVLG